MLEGYLNGIQTIRMILSGRGHEKVQFIRCGYLQDRDKVTKGDMVSVKQSEARQCKGDM